MKTFLKASLLCFLLFNLLLSCKEVQVPKANEPKTQTVDFEGEKQAILATLNNETKAAFQRDYEAWQSKWLHNPNISKTYIDFPENSFTESIGFDEVDRFVKDFFEKHPEPEPVPQLVDDIEVRLYGTGAWVTYEQQDSLRGRKRETRLMEKVDGEWKIAGMHTTIYGFEE